MASSRCRVAIAVEPAEHVAQIAVDEMVERVLQPAPLAGIAHRRMDAARPQRFAAGAIERGAHRGAVIGAPAVADQPAADMVGDRDEEIGLARRSG